MVNEIQYVYDSTSNEQVKNNINKNKYNTTIYNSDLDYIIEKSKQNTNEFEHNNNDINEIDFDNIDDDINTNNIELHSNSSNNSNKSTDKSSNKSSFEKEIENISKQISDIEQQIKEKEEEYNIIFNKIVNKRHESLREKAKKHIIELINNANILSNIEKSNTYMQNNNCTYLRENYDDITDLSLIKQEIKTLTNEQLLLQKEKDNILQKNTIKENNAQDIKYDNITFDKKSLNEEIVGFQNQATEDLLKLESIIDKSGLNVNNTISYIERSIKEDNTIRNIILNGTAQRLENYFIKVIKNNKTNNNKKQNINNKGKINNRKKNTINVNKNKNNMSKEMKFMCDNFDIISEWWINRTIAESESDSENSK